MSWGRVSAGLLAPLVLLGGCAVEGSPGPDAVTSSSGAATSSDTATASSDGGSTTAPGLDASAGAARDRVTVTGTAPPERRTAYVAMAETALAQVEDLWGPDAVRWPVRVVLPATPAEFADLTGGAAASQTAPAVTVGRLADAHVVVHPDSWDRLTPQGRQAVLTHEVTHLAQQGDGPVPRWLGEGMAELTAHRLSPLSPVTIAGSALDDVRAHRLPDDWPAPRAGDDAWGGYALSWLACLFIADTWSEQALLELYATVAAGASVTDAFPAVLGVTEDEALIGWGDWLRELVG